MQTLKLCRCGEPGIYCYLKSVEGREWEGGGGGGGGGGGVPRGLNCAWVYPKTQNRKKSEGSGQLTTRLWLSACEYYTY